MCVPRTLLFFFEGGGGGVGWVGEAGSRTKNDGVGCLVCLFVCLSVCLSVCLFVCLFRCVLFFLALFPLFGGGPMDYCA